MVKYVESEWQWPCRDLSIAGVDVGGADIKLNEDGSYTLALGCTDMGTGCDTIMAQIAADCLETPMENIVVFSVDTDISPYDSGSYASSTTYTTGVAVMKRLLKSFEVKYVKLVHRC